MYALSLKYLGEKGEVEVVCLCHKIGYMLQAAILSGKSNAMALNLALWHDQNNGVCLFLTTWVWISLNLVANVNVKEMGGGYM